MFSIELESIETGALPGAWPLLISSNITRLSNFPIPRGGYLISPIMI